MSVYTVHEPPPRKQETSAAPDRFVFVRDGFYFWAFLLGPLWMLWRRLWLVTVFYFVVIVALEAAMWAVQAPEAARVIIGLLMAVLIGFEAGTLRRWTLARRGWKNAGVVVADDLETAERRFFAAWTPPSAPPWGVPPSPNVWKTRESRDVIGLFPQPGAPR